MVMTFIGVDDSTQEEVRCDEAPDPTLDNVYLTGADMSELSLLPSWHLNASAPMDLFGV